MTNLLNLGSAVVAPSAEASLALSGLEPVLWALVGLVALSVVLLLRDGWVAARIDYTPGDLASDDRGSSPASLARDAGPVAQTS